MNISANLIEWYGSRAAAAVWVEAALRAAGVSSPRRRPARAPKPRAIASPVPAPVVVSAPSTPAKPAAAPRSAGPELHAIKAQIPGVSSPPQRLNIAIAPAPEKPAPKKSPRVAYANQTAVIPRGLKPTICPSPTHDARFQVGPGERPFGAGFAVVGFGRDITTGQAWA